MPSPPIISLYPQPDGTRVAELKTKLGLKDSFVLYPAHTWPHKNHIRLLEALAMLRDRRQIRLDLVCCGRRTDFYGEIARRVEELNLTGQVSFLGFVEPEELRLLYDTAHCMVFPSLFEGWGLPIYDAFFSGLPVASSNACDLADRLGDAAVLFDPTDVGQIADALHTVWFDSATRRTLVEQGRRHVEVLSWERIGRTLRAFYREAAGRPLGTEDHELVESSRR